MRIEKTEALEVAASHNIIMSKQHISLLLKSKNSYLDDNSLRITKLKLTASTFSVNLDDQDEALEQEEDTNKWPQELAKFGLRSADN